MAKQVITMLTDDLDGGEADRTVEFGLDGVNYTIDLSEKNAGKLRKALDPYLSAGVRVGRGGVGRRPVAAAAARSTRDENQAIREWAGKNGHEISGRGRIPVHVVEAYRKR
ncbi:histone-like nucleoid-structuring protein Lsr2 [Actinoplanes sp. CA-030573]|uniref:histone-like nucleoid-structuring protein Lsr2 n=1 Tax=Actinoplanes sp. CA-030573 TaxID=3239898 RepID=UPI003D910DCA